MTSTSPSARPTLLRGVPAQAGVGPARLDHDLRRPGLAEHGADPRLVDPGLEEAFDAAVARGVEAGVRRGYARGHEAGVAAGLAEARAQAQAGAQAHHEQQQAHDRQVQQVLGALSREATELQAQRARALALAAPDVVAAALELAELLLGHEVQVAKDPGSGALERALAAAPATSGAVVARLHPEDLAALSAVPAPEDVRLVADPGVRRGDCVVRAGDAEIDAQLRSALARIREVLLP